ncbi:U2 small nuclear ribonucleoprotein A [Acrasis kona]|uniref:U2 small nuclear ribonucleoprotein A n=1 Tax=Acrasis kona TaxID=1008807 RepID=A0AAW2ZLF5_9EUKA
MVRLTPDLIRASPQFVNPIKDRELDLRGHKIALIESLGVTGDSFDTIDFSDNEVTRLEAGSFPTLQRLQNLYLNNNRLQYIDQNVAVNVPNLKCLILTNNYFKELEQLQVLRHFENLETLSLVDNAVTRKENYRLYVVSLLPRLKYLDFQKIKQQERERAQIYGKDRDKEPKSNTFTPGSAMDQDVEPVQTLSKEDIQKIKDLITNANTIQEVNRYQEALNQGKMPKDL